MTNIFMASFIEIFPLRKEIPSRHAKEVLRNGREKMQSPPVVGIWLRHKNTVYSRRTDK